MTHIWLCNSYGMNIVTSRYPVDILYCNAISFNCRLIYEEATAVSLLETKSHRQTKYHNLMLKNILYSK